MAKLFLTGGSGFIGGEIAGAALALGHEVAVYDLVEPHFPAHRPFWIEGDVRDAEALRRAAVASGADILIHLASDTDVQITKMEEFTTTIDGTRNAIATVEAAPAIAKFVHVSTQFVVKPGVTPTSETFFDPYTVYGEAKAETERMVRAAAIAAPWLIVRPTIIWGPHHPSFRQNHLPPHRRAQLPASGGIQADHARLRLRHQCRRADPDAGALGRGCRRSPGILHRRRDDGL